jgi:alpha-L-fucosidase
LFIAPLISRAEDTAYVPETKEHRDVRMAWWRDAKFGIFIHWSLSSVHAGVLYGKDVTSDGAWGMLTAKMPVAEYAKLADSFNPTKFDATAWAELAQQAGAKYVVLTAKHHDGFAMFASKASPFNIVDATPYKKDTSLLLAEACRKEGLKFGFYYSHAQDWHHPGGGVKDNEGFKGHWDKAQDGDMTEYIKKVAAPQVKELLTNYGKIDVFWWDTAYQMTAEKADLLHPLLKLQPGIIANDRLVWDPIVKVRPDLAGDVRTAEQHVPERGYPGRDWEVCMTMNDTWGYKRNDHHWKSTETLLRILIDVVSKGGNYLLNIGPTSEGTIPPESVACLQQIGKWMAVNGEAIYGTKASPFEHVPAWGRATTKPGKVYLFVFDWPEDGRLDVPLTNPVAKAYLLARPDEPLLVAQDSTVHVSLPPSAPDPIASVIVLESLPPAVSP